MNKKLLLFASLFLASTFAFSGGLVTNTNQSTAWARMLVRDASTGIDAVFYNPAGLSKLSDGFHFSINNQSLFQTQDINSTFPYLNDQDFHGTVKAPLFPGVYGVYKTGKVALSFGFNPVGGGGGATFETGLPTLAIPFAGLVPAMSALPNLGQSAVTGYNADLFFEGSSVYFGLQAGVTYEINDMFSVYLGGRYVMAKNTYNGFVENVAVNTADGESVKPGDYVSDVAGLAVATAAAATDGGDAIIPLIAGYGSDYLVADLPAAYSAGIISGLTQMGIDPTGMSISEAQANFYGIAGQLNDGLPTLYGTAAYLNLVTANQTADVVQKGNGFTPIIGANLTFLEGKLNIGLKYEFLTKMDLVDEVAADENSVELGFVDGAVTGTLNPTYMFNDGDITNADIPAFLSVGAAYQATDKLNVTVGFHTYFDEQAGWATNEDGDATVDGNFLEYGLGLEYAFTEKFLLSAGYLGTKTSATEFYNDDLSFSLNTNTFGGGGAYKINDIFTAQVGAFYTMYQEDAFDKVDSTTGIPYVETYNKMTWAFSLGVDISLGGMKK